MGNQTLRERALEQIRLQILSGSWSSRDMKSEREIAEQLQVSRTPVREALAILVQQGLVNNYPQVGVEVRVPTFHEVTRALQLRRGLESVVVAELAKRKDRRALEAVDRMREATDDTLSAWSERCARFRQADTAFHCELARLAGFETSVGLIRSLRDKIHLYRLNYPSATAEEHALTIREHEKIAEAVVTGRVRPAVRALVNHLKHTYDRLQGVPTRTVEDPELEGAGVPAAIPAGIS